MRTVALTLLLALQVAAQAISILGTSDPWANTAAPDLTGWQNSGWQYQGEWNGYCGTPIAPRWFVAARHVSGGIGQAFTFQGQLYTTVDVRTSDAADLALWQVDRPFPVWAPVYTRNDELGKPVLMIGRGWLRGSKEVLASCDYQQIWTKTTRAPRPAWPGPAPAYSQLLDRRTTYTNIVTVTHLVGWELGTYDGVMRWGTNTVSDVTPDMVTTTFDAGAGYYEGQAAPGDSSGAIYCRDLDGIWKLDAVISAVNGYHFYVDGRGWTTGCEGSGVGASQTFGTRIAGQWAWVQAVIGGAP